MSPRLSAGIVFAIAALGFHSAWADGTLGDGIELDLNLKVSDTGICEISGDLINHTKYRFHKAAILLPTDYPIDLPEVPARSQLDTMSLPEVDPRGAMSTCGDVAEALVKAAKSVKVTECSLEGVAEGDCQDAIKVTPKFDMAAIASGEAKFVEHQNASAIPVANYRPIKGGSLPIVRANEGSPAPASTPSDISHIDIDDSTASERQQGVVKVMEVGKDKRGLIRWYFITLYQMTMRPADKVVSGWVPAKDLSRIFGPPSDWEVMDAAKETEAEQRAVSLDREDAAAKERTDTAIAKCDNAAKAISASEADATPSEADIKNALQGLFCRTVGKDTPVTVESIENLHCVAAAAPEAVKALTSGKSVYRCDFTSTVNNTKTDQRRTDKNNPLFVRSGDGWRFILANKITP